MLSRIPKNMKLVLVAIAVLVLTTAFVMANGNLGKRSEDANAGDAGMGGSDTPA